MLTSKQRAKLRAIANPMDTIIQIGKGGITESTIKQTEEALTARELIKLRVLETAGITAREAAEILVEKTAADPVQVIGTRFVLFRRNKKKPQISLD